LDDFIRHSTGIKEFGGLAAGRIFSAKPIHLNDIKPIIGGDFFGGPFAVRLTTLLTTAAEGSAGVPFERSSPVRMNF
jgi:hypothetical protein